MRYVPHIEVRVKAHCGEPFKAREKVCVNHVLHGSMEERSEPTGTQKDEGHPSYVQPLKNAKEEIFLGEGNTVKNMLSPFLNVD